MFALLDPCQVRNVPFGSTPVNVDNSNIVVPAKGKNSIIKDLYSSFEQRKESDEALLYLSTIGNSWPYLDKLKSLKVAKLKE